MSSGLPAINSSLDIPHRDKERINLNLKLVLIVETLNFIFFNLISFILQLPNYLDSYGPQLNIKSNTQIKYKKVLNKKIQLFLKVP